MQDGVEQTFQVNHLSHWVFVQTLTPLLERTGIVRADRVSPGSTKTN